MNYLSAAATADLADIDDLAQDKRFRRATINMKLAYRCLEQLFRSLPTGCAIDHEQVGLVLGTSHGEVIATREYLKYLAEGHSRPFLFQNSLHNSTTGFIATQFQLQGPTFTLSVREYSGESALDLGLSLLAGGTCANCIVMGIDVWEPLFNKTTEKLYGLAQGESSGAAALLLTADPYPQSRGILNTSEGPEQTTFAAANFYGSCGTRVIAEAFLNRSLGRELMLSKPRGHSYKIEFADVEQN